MSKSEDLAMIALAKAVQASSAVGSASAAAASAEAAAESAEEAAEYAAEAFSGTPEGYEALVGDVGDLNSAFDIRKSENIFDNSFPNSGLIDTSGADSVSASYVRTDYLPVDPNNSKLYFVRSNQPYILYVCFYDSEKTALNNGGSNNRVTLFTQTTTAVKANTSIPATAAYYRLATNATNFAGTLCVSYSQLDVVVPYGDYIISKLSSLYGKTIAFFGDSIIGNLNDHTGICKLIESKTGATVHNCAFGGSRMAYRYGDNLQYTYWNALSGVELMKAIATNTWTAQETAVENMTGGLPYFADRLTAVKAIDFSKVEIILWEYGTNDFSTEVMLSNDDDSTDMYAFKNAYKAAIEAILTAYPNILLIPITPTWRFWDDDGEYLYDSNTHTTDDYDGTARLLTAFVEIINSVSKAYQLPVIDDYYTLGANRFTRLAYFDSTDGVHPNANGRKRIAEHIVSQLDGLI